jgi:ankyrin repeat protein
VNHPRRFFVKPMLIRILLKRLFFVLLCTHYLSGVARSYADEIVARVNGESISRSLYERFRGYREDHLTRRFTGDDLNRELATQQQDVLRTLIEERLLRQRAVELGISPETEVIKHLDQTRRDSGFDDFESLEQSFVDRGVDPREFKYDLERQVLEDRLLRADVNHRSNSSAQVMDPNSREAGTHRQSLERQRKEAIQAQGSLHDYIQGLRRAGIIEVKRGFVDTGVAYTEDVNQNTLIAARIGDTRKIRTLLANGAAPNTVGSEGYTALMHAAEMGHQDTVEALLAEGASPNPQSHSGYTALLLATMEGYRDIVRVLLANEADPDAHDSDGMTPLIQASVDCNNDIVASLLERKPDVNAGDVSGRTALIGATTEGCSAIVSALLSEEADPDLADNGGRTALMYAVESGRKDLIQALLERSAGVNARDNEGKTALTYAVIAQRIDLAQQLLLSNADVRSGDNENQTPLMYAAAAGKEEMVQILLEAGADPKAETWSLRLVRYNPVGIPLETGNNDEQGLRSGLTALDIARRSRHSGIVDLLQKTDARR